LSNESVNTATGCAMIVVASILAFLCGAGTAALIYFT
jgi:hypothetical protein